MTHRVEITSIAVAAVMALGGLLSVFPGPGWWIELHSLAVYDGPAGSPANIEYARTIHRDFKGRWQVDIRRAERGQWTSYCTTPWRDQPYSVDAVLPDAINLEWLAYTDPRCWQLPRGTYTASVHIEVNPGGFWTRDAMVTSQPFEVR